MLLLQQVEILENDRSESPQSGDIEATFLGQFHGIEDLAAGGFKAPEHFRNKHRVDIGPLNLLARQAGHRDAFDQLGWGAAPHVQIASGVLLIAK